MGERREDLELLRPAAVAVSHRLPTGRVPLANSTVMRRARRSVRCGGCERTFGEPGREAVEVDRGRGGDLDGAREGDIAEATRTSGLVAGVASAARRETPVRVVLGRVRPATAPSKHALAEAATSPEPPAEASDLVAYGEMGFSPDGCRRAKRASNSRPSWRSRAVWDSSWTLDARRQLSIHRTTRHGGCTVEDFESTRTVPAVFPGGNAPHRRIGGPGTTPAVAHVAGADAPVMLSARPTEASLEALAGYTSEHGTTQRRAIAEALEAKGIKVVARDSENRPRPRRRGRADTEGLDARRRHQWRMASPVPSPVWRGAPHSSRRRDGAGVSVWQRYACNRTYCVLLPASARDGLHRSDSHGRIGHDVRRLAYSVLRMAVTGVKGSQYPVERVIFGRLTRL